MGAAKDDPKIQRDRLERLAKEAFGDCLIYFDPDQPVRSIRMRVDDSKTGKVLMALEGYWHVSQIADKSDGELRLLLIGWAKK